MAEKWMSKDWKIHYFGQIESDNFMNKYYNNTSILWAYNLINPQERISQADIWRYAILYAFGGFYIDDDAFINSNIDRVSSSIRLIILDL